MIDLSHAIKESNHNSRLCPIPEVWQKIYDLLPDKTINGKSPAEFMSHMPEGLKIDRLMRQPVGMPEFKSDMCRTSLFICLRLDFREHLSWASEHGVIEDVYQIIHNLPEDQWLHHGDTIKLPSVLHKPSVVI